LDKRLLEVDCWMSEAFSRVKPESRVGSASLQALTPDMHFRATDEVHPDEAEHSELVSGRTGGGVGFATLAKIAGMGAGSRQHDMYTQSSGTYRHDMLDV
jgi:hypothetical protein